MWTEDCPGAVADAVGHSCFGDDLRLGNERVASTPVPADWPSKLVAIVNEHSPLHMFNHNLEPRLGLAQELPLQTTRVLNTTQLHNVMHFSRGKLQGRPY